MMTIVASSAMRGGWMSGGVGWSAAESENRRAMGIFILSSSDWLQKRNFACNWTVNSYLFASL